MGLGEVGGEDMDGVLAYMGDLGVKSRDLGGGVVILARTTGATGSLSLESAQLLEPVFEGPGICEFANDFVGGTTVASLLTPTSTPTTESGWVTPVCWGRATLTRTAAMMRSPWRESVTPRILARFTASSRSIRRVFS